MPVAIVLVTVTMVLVETVVYSYGDGGHGHGVRGSGDGGGSNNGISDSDGVEDTLTSLGFGMTFMLNACTSVLPLPPLFPGFSTFTIFAISTNEMMRPTGVSLAREQGEMSKDLQGHQVTSGGNSKLA